MHCKPSLSFYLFRVKKNMCSRRESPTRSEKARWVTNEKGRGRISRKERHKFCTFACHYKLLPRTTLMYGSVNYRQNCSWKLKIQGFEKDWFPDSVFSVPGPEVSCSLKSEETYLCESSNDKEDLMCLL